MNNFHFVNPTKILFGKGQIVHLSKELPPDARILFLYGGGSIRQNGVYQATMEQLKGFTVVEFSGVEPNPRYETLMKAVQLIKDQSLNFILAVGGGSVIDGAKFIAGAVFFEGNEPWDIMSKKVKPTRAVPIGTILTLPATASEMNANYVITREASKEKLGASSPLLYPKFSILDPEYTFTLPARQIANGIVDAFTHVVEQYMTYPANTPLQDRFAESILLTLMEEGPKTLSNPHDYDSRANVMWAATLALNGLIGVGVPQDWAIHNIGHELTALHEIDHARTLAIVLPGIYRFKAAAKREKLLQYAERVWSIVEGSEEERIEAAISRTEAFFRSLGIGTRLADYQVPDSSIEEIARRISERYPLGIGEHRDISGEETRQILELVRN